MEAPNIVPRPFAEPGQVLGRSDDVAEQHGGEAQLDIAPARFGLAAARGLALAEGSVLPALELRCRETPVTVDRQRLAEREGFEPSDPCGSPVFKTGAFVLSATAPLGIVGSPVRRHRVGIWGPASRGPRVGGAVYDAPRNTERCRSQVDRASLLRR